MKKLKFLFYLSTLTLVFFSCKKLGAEKELKIYIGTDFNDDNVTIKLDDNVVYSNTVTTNQLIGVGEVLTLDFPVGRYELNVNVNGIEETEKFRHKKNRLVYITFDKNSSKITLSYPEEEPILD